MASAEIEYYCFVGGLAWATNNDALKKAFAIYGEIVESKVRLSQAMRDAIEGMNGQSLDNRNITMNEAQSRERGGGGGDYSCGGGGGEYGGGSRREGGGGGYNRNSGGSGGREREREREEEEEEKEQSLTREKMIRIKM